MITLLKWTLLRIARRRYPELFDPQAAVDAVNGQLDDYLAQELA